MVKSIVNNAVKQFRNITKIYEQGRLPRKLLIYGKEKVLKSITWVSFSSWIEKTKILLGAEHTQHCRDKVA